MNIKQIVKLFKPTHSVYMFFQIRKVWPKDDDDEFEITNSHYTERGMMAHITDKTDGQKYILEIYPDA